MQFEYMTDFVLSYFYGYIKGMKSNNSIAVVLITNKENRDIFFTHTNEIQNLGKPILMINLPRLPIK